MILCCWVIVKRNWRDWYKNLEVCQRRKLSVNETKSKILKKERMKKRLGWISVQMIGEWKKLKPIGISEWTCRVVVEWVRR